MRKIIPFFVLLLCTSELSARQRAQGYCEQGGKTVVTGGLNGTPRVQGSYPGCTVTVYLTGTLTLATIYSDNSGTVLANPFTANTTTGLWYWYADNGRYDVRLSGGGIASPFTIGDILLSDGAGSTSVSSITAGAGISVNQPTGAVTVTNTWGAVPVGSQTQQLQIQPNTGNNTTYQWASKPWAVPTDYNFTAQQPGGSLSSGIANTVTLTPCPNGINGTDSRHYLYVSGGVGTAETVLITGGTCTSGASTGTVVFTPANAHSGAWTIQSATAGIQEALQANRAVYVAAGAYTIYAAIFLNVGPSANCALVGAGVQATVLQRAAAYQGDIIQFDQSVNTGMGCTIADLTIENGGVPIFNNTAGAGINLAQFGTVPLNIHNIRVHNGWNGFVLGSGANLFMTDVAFDLDGSYSALYQSNAAFTLGTTGVVADTTIQGFRIYADLSQAFPLSFGFKLGTVDGLSISNSMSSRADIGMYFLANSGSITNVNVNNVTWDGFTNRCFLFSGANVISSIAISNTTCNGYAAASPPQGVGGAAAVEFDNTTVALQSVEWTGGDINGASQFGVWYRSPSTVAAVVIAGATIQNNGNGATGYGVFSTGYGLALTGNRIYSVSGTGFTQDYGVGFTGTVTDQSIIGNNVNDNATAGIILGAATFAGNTIIANNAGYNSTAGPASITVGASPYTYTAGPSPEMVYIYGGTVSAVKRGATTVATASPAQVYLGPLQTVQVTYAVAPTMVKDIQ